RVLQIGQHQVADGTMFFQGFEVELVVLFVTAGFLVCRIEDFFLDLRVHFKVERDLSQQLFAFVGVLLGGLGQISKCLANLLVVFLQQLGRVHSTFSVW